MSGVSSNKVEKALRELSDRLALQNMAQDETSEKNKNVQKLIGEICFKFDLSPIEEESLRRSFKHN